MLCAECFSCGPAVIYVVRLKAQAQEAVAEVCAHWQAQGLRHKLVRCVDSVYRSDLRV